MCSILHGVRTQCWLGQPMGSRNSNHEVAAYCPDAVFRRSHPLPFLRSPKPPCPHPARTVTRSASFTTSASASTLMSPPSSPCCLPKVFPFQTSSGCFARFILRCSLNGSSLIPFPTICPGSRYSQATNPLHFCASLDNRPNGFCHLDWASPGSGCLYNNDWRKGRADNLVSVLQFAAGLRKTPRCDLLIGRLVRGRFLAGARGWLSIPVPTGRPVQGSTKKQPRRRRRKQQQLCSSSSTVTLVDWLSAWIRHGAVIVLAQLDSAVTGDESAAATNDRSSSTDPVTQELIWRHRVVYGISADGECVVEGAFGRMMFVAVGFLPISIMCVLWNADELVRDNLINQMTCIPGSMASERISNWVLRRTTAKRLSHRLDDQFTRAQMHPGMYSSSSSRLLHMVYCFQLVNSQLAQWPSPRFLDFTR